MNASNESQLDPVRHWIAGRSTGSTGTRSKGDGMMDIVDPESDSVIGKALRGTNEDVVQAIDAAEIAFASFSRSGPSFRESILRKAALLLQEQAEEFERLLIEETGSPVSKAKMEVAMSTRILQANAAMARQMTGRTYQSDVAGRMSFALRQPLGVVAGITPFNVPLIKGIKHSSMPLATGNTFVWLASEHAPRTAERVAMLFHQAGAPDGVFNFVSGIGSEIGDALTGDRRVRAVSFTGSARVGKSIQQRCGELGKRVTLELGGKNPLVVLADADLDAAVTAAVRGGFLYQGQICMASSRVVVEQGIFDAFSERFVAAAKAIPIDGDLREPTTLIGPIIDESSRRRIREHLADAADQGARILCGNKWSGNRVNPTIITGVLPTMRMFNEETFGPVVSLEPATGPEHALELANRSPSLLSAAVFTRDLGLAMSFAEKLNTAMVHVNDMTIQQEPEVPFGGDGESGFGREGMETGVDDYTTWKWITFKT